MDRGVNHERHIKILLIVIASLMAVLVALIFGAFPQEIHDQSTMKRIGGRYTAAAQFDGKISNGPGEGAPRPSTLFLEEVYSQRLSGSEESN
jgi:hypothetical protein